MKIENRLQRILTVLDAQFVAFVSEAGKVITGISREKTSLPVETISGLVRAIVLSERSEQNRLREALCTGLSSKIAIIHMEEDSISGFLVVGMPEDFDILAMRGVLNQVGERNV